ncbi:MAG TPA: sensor histidine kinase [Verrucomicrobiae bacterium]|nr:sensor histidine kinase [Verrucomicrobiae bacterium]
MTKPLPLRVRVFIATAVSSLIPLLLAITILHFDFIKSLEGQIASEAMDIATLTAGEREVKTGYADPDPTARLQPIAENIREHTEAAFVVFMDNDGKRFTHPNPSLIGLRFSGGDEGPALAGNSYTSKAVGVSGPSIRAFKPIYGLNGEQVGAVAVGFFEPDISLILANTYRALYTVIPLGLILIVFLSIFLASNIKNLMFGMEPLEIAVRLKEREGMLQSVKEGIIAIDQDCQITVVNQVAQNLLPPGIKVVARPIHEIIPDSQLPEVLVSKQAQQDEQVSINGNVVLTNRVPLISGGKVVGAIATFRPLTELNRVAEELTGVKKIVNALRARTHEFSNKLHVISGMLQLESYDEARKYIANVSRSEHSLISFLIDNIHSSAVAGLLAGKASEATERQVLLDIDRNSQLIELPSYFDEHAMVVVLGNLIENAFDAVENSIQRYVWLSLMQSPSEIEIVIRDTGCGITEENCSLIFESGFTTKEKGLGVGLANLKNRVEVAGGVVSFQSTPNGTVFRVIIPYQL